MRIGSRIVSSLGLSLTVVAAFASASYAALSAPNGAASFKATGPAGLVIEGKSSDVTVGEKQDGIHVTVPLDRVATGIALRDKHMREKYLETQKYPNAELVVARGALRFPEEGAETSASANGTLTIHGQSRPVTFTYRAKKAGGAFDVTGATHINMQDYGIHVPSYLGVTVKPDVDISVHFVAKDS